MAVSKVKTVPPKELYGKAFRMYQRGELDLELEPIKAPRGIHCPLCKTFISCNADFYRICTYELLPTLNQMKNIKDRNLEHLFWLHTNKAQLRIRKHRMQFGMSIFPVGNYNLDIKANVTEACSYSLNLPRDNFHLATELKTISQEWKSIAHNHKKNNTQRQMLTTVISVLDKLLLKDQEATEASITFINEMFSPVVKEEVITLDE